MPTISKRARARLKDRARRLSALRNAVDARWLMVAGDHLMLDVAALFDEHPALAALEIELASEYDDRGGYFDTFHVAVAIADADDDDSDESVDEDAIRDDWEAVLNEAGYDLVSARFAFDDLREVKITRADALELEAEVVARLSGAS